MASLLEEIGRERRAGAGSIGVDPELDEFMVSSSIHQIDAVSFLAILYALLDTVFDTMRDIQLLFIVRFLLARFFFSDLFVITCAHVRAIHSGVVLPCAGAVQGGDLAAVRRGRFVSQPHPDAAQQPLQRRQLTGGHRHALR